VKTYYVYIMSNHARTLYTGITSDLPGRVYQHKTSPVSGFTSKYHVTSLVYYEETSDVLAAIAREKQIKGWLRKRKIALIESLNPYWFDLSDVFLGSVPRTAQVLRSAQEDKEAKAPR
jgi:putative endonuclease